MKVRLSNGEFIELSQAQREAILSALGHDLANK